jgi:pimeloyl-ACP methyl ester carboxylesterase
VLIDSLFPVVRPKGLMVTSGGWLYCANVRQLARTAGYTLLCGRYARDGYVASNLRSRRHLDWGNPRYLAQLAARIRQVHGRVGGPLVLVGVSYSGFGVATLASHHPEIRPDRLIVVDSYLDLVARRRHAGPRPIGLEIDRETGGSLAALRARSVDVGGLAALLRRGTRLTVIWSVSPEENRFFRGATCARDANAETLGRLARTLGRAVPGWVTEGLHGHDLWDNGQEIMGGTNPGRKVWFRPDGRIPRSSHCP